MKERAALVIQAKDLGIRIVFLTLVAERFPIGVRKIWHGSLRKRFSCRDRSWGSSSRFQRGRVYLLCSLGKVDGSQSCRAIRTAETNFVLRVIDEVRDGAVGPDSPTREDI